MDGEEGVQGMEDGCQDGLKLRDVVVDGVEQQLSMMDLMNGHGGGRGGLGGG